MAPINRSKFSTIITLLTTTALWSGCEGAKPTIVLSEGNAAGGRVLRLVGTECQDPDLAQLEKGQKLMLCDGSIAEGTLEPLALCASDGQQDCLNQGDFRAAKVRDLNASDIRHGKTIAGVVGTKRDMRQCRNAADLTSIDIPADVSSLPVAIAAASMNFGSDIINLGVNHYLQANAPLRVTTTGSLPAELSAGTTYYTIVSSATQIQLAATPGGAAIDYASNGSGNHTFWQVGDGIVADYDTLDDRNRDKPNSPQSSPWGDSYICNESNFTNVSAQFVPTGTMIPPANRVFSQVWRDELTGMLFTNVLATGGTSWGTWAHGVKLCESLSTTSAGPGWRLPTQKELIQLYIDGIGKVPVDGGVWHANFRSATAVSTNLTYAWLSSLSDAYVNTDAPRGYADHTIICVKQPD